MFKVLLFIISFFMLPITSQAFTKVQSIEGITEYRLTNGLQVLFITDASKPSMTVNMTYRVGSRHEQYGQTGMAHLLEHLVFRGTKDYPDVLQQFSQKGLSANGTTSFDRTNYYASFAADEATLEWYLRWQADTMQHLAISEEDLKKEVDIVLNERDRSQNNPMQVLFERIKATAYQWNNAGIAIIGAPDNLKNMTATDLQAFYHHYYQPDNATLIIAGLIDEEKTIALVDHIFSPIAKPTRQLIERTTQEPVQDGERNIILRQVGNMPFVGVAYRIPSAASPDYTALDMAVNILTDRPSGQLYRTLVQDKKLATNISGFTHTLHDSALAFFGAQLSEGQAVNDSQDALNHIIEHIAEHPFTEAELNRVRTYWLNQWQKLYANTEQLSIGLSEAIAAGDWRLFFLERDYVKASTLAQVQEVASKYFIPSNRTSGQYIPTETISRAPKIEPVDLSKLFEHYKGDNHTVTTEAFDPSPDNIQAKTLRQDLVLNNGVIHYALLPKSSRGNRVYANYRIKFSNLDNLSGQATLSGFAASLITSGTDTLSQQDIQDKIDTLNGSLSYHISANQLVVSLSTTEEHLTELLGFSLDLIQKASYPQKELTNFLAQVKRAIQVNSTEPAAKAAYQINRYLSRFDKNDFRYVQSFEEQLATINTINREKLLSFNRKNFAAGDIDISIVGTFNPDAVLDTLKQKIGTWKKAPEYTYITDPYGEYPAKSFTLQTPDKPNAIFLGRLLLPVQNTDKDFPALLVANHLLGGSEASRLFKSVRADKGLSYSIYSGINASAFEPSAEWTIQAIYSPEKKAEITQTIQQTMADIQQHGFTQEELDSGIASIMNMRALSRTQDNVLSATWLRYLENGRDFNWNKQFEERIKALTLDEVNAAAKKYLKFEQISTAYAGDFEMKK